MAKIFYRQIILLFFLLFSGFIKSYTQEIFLPGYIITRGGEKLNGLVAFRTVRKLRMYVYSKDLRPCSKSEIYSRCGKEFRVR
jgi:hypothetical protein